MTVKRIRAAFVVAAISIAPAFALADAAPAAIAKDPPHEREHPARMEVLHIPSGGVEINGIAYLPAGTRPHPVVVLFHGLPGNEQNLDLAQAIRRAGWAVVTFHYRGSWGSPGDYRFSNNLEDAAAVLKFLRDGDRAKSLGLDVSRIALVGHSMGGWVTLNTLAHDSDLLGGAIISAGDLGLLGTSLAQDRARAAAVLRDNGVEGLANTSPEILADELIAHGSEWSFKSLVPRLASRQLAVLYGDDFLTAHATALLADLKAAGATSVLALHVATDHSWSDRRIALEAAILAWLEKLPGIKT